jgi:hypothetical protein
MIYDWVLVAVLSTNLSNVDYRVIDYYKTKQQCMLVSKQQSKITNNNYMCLPIDKN